MERLAPLARRLDAFVTGIATPADPRETIDLILICQYTQQWAAYTRFCAAAFEAHPPLADDLKSERRYIAACVAALAAAGQGKDAGKLNVQERARLRRQALDWLRADLTARQKLADGGKASDRASVHAKMRLWQQDSNFAAVRDAQALERLPEDERTAWRQLWSDVDTLQKRTASEK
jgi:hypothetical protein